MLLKNNWKMWLMSYLIKTIIIAIFVRVFVFCAPWMTLKAIQTYEMLGQNLGQFFYIDVTFFIKL